jgi:hypothetical protein
MSSFLQTNTAAGFLPTAESTVTMIDEQLDSGFCANFLIVLQLFALLLLVYDLIVPHLR